MQARKVMYGTGLAIMLVTLGFKVGAVQIDLRDVRRNPITLHAAGMVGSVPNDMAPFQSRVWT